MSDDVLALADRLWRGELGSGDYHPVSHLGGLAEICDGVEPGEPRPGPSGPASRSWRLSAG